MTRFMLRSAVHLFFVRGGQILLLRRSNTGYEDGKYSVPAGHLEGGEPVLAAAAREAQEEVGLSLSPADLEVVGVMHRRSDDERIDFFVLADQWPGEPHNAEPDKCDDLRWFPLDALPENVIPYVRRAISNYLNHVPFAVYGWDAVPASNSGLQPSTQPSNAIELGLEKAKTFEVTEDRTAAHLGSGAVKVLSTPSMILFMEITARTLLDEHLPEGYSSVGTRVDVRHLAAAPLGAQVTARAVVARTEGNRVHLVVECRFGDTLVGQGHHERFIIDVERFLKRARAG